MIRTRAKRSRRLNNSAQIALPFGQGGIRRSAEKRDRPPLPSGDWVLLAIVLSLSIVGLVMVYNASSILAERTYHDSFYFIKKQLQWSMIAFILFMVTSKLELDKLRNWIVPMAILTFVMLASVLIFGTEINGSRRWIGLGPISFQPSEIAKLFTVIYLAHYIAKKGERLEIFFNGAAPPIIVIGLMSLLILVEPDLGSTVVILLMTFSLFFLGGVPMKQLLTMGLMIAPIVSYWVISSPYRLERLMTFMNPGREPFGSGFQVIQSHVALGSGGLTGTGLAEGKQLLFFLPEPHTDFIFAVIGEAFGLLGTIMILSLFVSILWRGTLIAVKCENPFSRYLAIGMTLLITLPALLNMGVVTGLLPTKGLPLPFLSYGGSSLLTNGMAVGFLYNVSRWIQGRPVGPSKRFTIWEGQA